MRLESRPSVRVLPQDRGGSERLNTGALALGCGLRLNLSNQAGDSRKDRSLQLLVSGSILVGDSYDRRVDIALRLRSGEETVATQTLRNVSAEEERVTPFRIVVPVDESALSAAYAATQPATVELTLTVRDDS